MCLTFTLLPVIWEHAHAQGYNCTPSFWRSGIAQLLGEEICLTRYSALLGPHHTQAGSQSSLTAARPLLSYPGVSWLQGRASPLTPALAAFSCFASPSCRLVLCEKPLFSVSLMSALLLSFHWSSLFPLPSHHYSTSSLPLLYMRYHQSWLPFTPFPPQDQTCSISVVPSVVLPGLPL